MSRLSLAGLLMLVSVVHEGMAFAAHCRRSPHLASARELTDELHYEDAQALLAGALDYSNVCLCEARAIRALRGYVAAVLCDEVTARREFRIEASMLSWRECDDLQLWPPQLPPRVRRIREDVRRAAPRIVLGAVPTERARGELAAWKVMLEDPFQIAAEVCVESMTGPHRRELPRMCLPLTSRLAIPAEGTSHLAWAGVTLRDAHQNEVLSQELPNPWRSPEDKAGPPAEAPRPGYVIVDTSRFAELYFQGHWVGYGSDTRVRLPPGEHQLRAVSTHPDAERLVTVNVVSGRTLRYALTIP